MPSAEEQHAEGFHMSFRRARGGRHLHSPAAIAFLATLAQPHVVARKNAFATAGHRRVRIRACRTCHERQQHCGTHNGMLKLATGFWIPVSTSSLKINFMIWPRSRKNEISDISPGQKCIIHIEMSDSRMSCSWNGARKSS